MCGSINNTRLNRHSILLDLLILYMQNPKEMFSKFKVLLVEGKKGSAATYNQIAKFIGDKLNLKKIESERVFYELSLSGPTICLTHYVEVISINVSQSYKCIRV